MLHAEESDMNLQLAEVILEEALLTNKRHAHTPTHTHTVVLLKYSMADRLTYLLIYRLTG